MADAPLETQRNFVENNVWSAGINQDVALRRAEMRTLLSDALSQAHPDLNFTTRALGARQPRPATPTTQGHSDAPIVPALPDLLPQVEVAHGRAASGPSIGKTGLSSAQKERASGPRAPLALHVPSMCAMFMLGCVVGFYVRRGARAQSVHTESKHKPASRVSLEF